MSMIANPEVSRSNDGRSARDVVGTVSLAVSGCLLFAASRKLVWGYEESFADLGLWLLALAPYVGFFFFSRLDLASNRTIAFLRGSDFLAIWTFSLLFFVILRTTTLSKLFENDIYGSFGPGVARYFLLSMVYIGFGYVAVTAWRLTRPHFAAAREIVLSRAVSFFAGAVLFCCAVFLIAL